ncbi:MAG: hypothetical protein JXC36_08445, partial [Candidatus Atribacteria bacterium]|nr:hypothetical protein [Candidatus Atribacteria bacterium]
MNQWFSDIRFKKILSRTNSLRLFYFIMILVLSAFSCSSLILGSEVPSFAVYDFHNQSGDEGWQWLEKGMTDMLNHTFSQFHLNSYLPPSRMDQIPGTDQFRELSTRKSLSEFRSLSDLLHIEMIFTGNYQIDFQEIIRFSLIMYKSATQELIEFRDISASPENILQIKEELARVILSEIGIEIDERAEELLTKNISHSL